MFQPWRHTHYDSLQATLERRFAKGYQINAMNRAVMSTDRPHVFTFSSIAELPFGQGKRWLSNGGAGSALAGGWQVNGLFSSYSGLPFAVSASGASLDAPGNAQRADQVKPAVKKLGNASVSGDPAWDQLQLV